MHEAHYNKHLLVALIVKTRSELIIFKITIQLGIKHGFRFRMINGIKSTSYSTDAVIVGFSQVVTI